MPEFLQLCPPQEALARLMDNLPGSQPRVENLLTAQALGRVTAAALVSPEALPAFARSTVDGFAVNARDTFGAGESLPAYLALAGEVTMGSAPDFSLLPGQSALIHTGGMLPPGADAVVMLEYTQMARAGELEVLRAAAPGENVLHAGEDIQAGQVVLPAGTRLRPAEIGGLLALGLTEVALICKPRVAILSSGDEVVPPEAQAGPGQVRDINSYTLAALVEQYGGQAVRFGIVPDTASALDTTLRAALERCDMAVITAGSSASTRDLTADAIARMGQPGVLVHGVNVKPGKPTILGVCDGKAVVGLPGNPVSALVIARLFVVPLLRRLSGLEAEGYEGRVLAHLTASIPSQAGRDDYVPVELLRTPQGLKAAPIFYKSNLIFTLARASGLVHIPADATGLAVGEQVEVEII
jgi:molybdopterin molybdotransferase